jgi:uncharacterized protein involved in exopolysaccharide biosynthesis
VERVDGRGDPEFVRAELEVICSQLILSKVIQDLNLNSVWGRKYIKGEMTGDRGQLYPNGETLKTAESLQLLRGRLDLHAMRDTSLIEIQSFSENRDEAAQVANAIAETYCDHRRREQQRVVTANVRALEEAGTANDAKIQAMRAEIDDLASERGSERERRLEAAKGKLEDLQRLRQTLLAEIAAEKLNFDLPLSRMVQIVDRASPALKPKSPNKPLNIVLSVFVGGVVGSLLASVLYVVERLVHQPSSGSCRSQLPAQLRAVLHAIIALVVGTVVGYWCATPLSFGSTVTVPFAVLLGAAASALVESANGCLTVKPHPGERLPRSKF